MLAKTKTLICCCLGLLAAPTFAQQITLKENKPVYNVIKAGLLNYATNGRADFSFERRIMPKQSIQATVGIGFPVTVPTRFSQSFKVTNNTQFSINVPNFVWRSYSFFGEYRFYVLKEDAPRGLYISPYVKANIRGFDVEGSYTRPDSVDVNNQVITTVSANAHIKGGFNSFGAGLLLGYHFILNDRVSIDLAPLGLGIDVHRFYADFSTSDADVNRYFDDWKNAVNTQIQDIPIIGDILKTSSGTNADGSKFINAHLTFPFIAYRGNISIGYAF